MTTEEIRDLKNHYMSDQTAYMRWSTEIEAKEDMIDHEFIKRNHIILGFADKFLSMANFTEPNEKILHKLKMCNATLEISAGLPELAETTLASAWDDICMSRGDKGFFTRIQVTQRHELTESKPTETEKKAGMLSGIFGGKKPQQENQGGK